MEVDDVVGKLYHNFSDEGKNRFKEAVSLMLKKTINDSTLDGYKGMLDQFGKEATENGLTKMTLDRLLADD